MDLSNKWSSNSNNDNNMSSGGKTSYLSFAPARALRSAAVAAFVARTKKFDKQTDKGRRRQNFL